MDLKRNIGIIMMMLGVLLTINQPGDQNDFIRQVEQTIKDYWPLILSFIGIYMISAPKKKH